MIIITTHLFKQSTSQNPSISNRHLLSDAFSLVPLAETANTAWACQGEIQKTSSMWAKISSQAWNKRARNMTGV